jgi:hypothetical protein
MIAGIILLINMVVASASTWLGLRATDVLGNLLLVEIATFFIVAGILDFATSVGIAQLRKVLFPGRGGFSTSGRRDSERSALVFVAVGLILSLIMILLALFDMSMLRP